MNYGLEDASGGSNEEVVELLRQAKIIAVRYRQLTGKPLGITGEVAEFEAAAILGLDLHAARTAGYDATEMRDGKPVRVQIKGRCIADPKRATGRVGKIDLSQPFDTVLLAGWSFTARTSRCSTGPPTTVETAGRFCRVVVPGGALRRVDRA